MKSFPILIMASMALWMGGCGIAPMPSEYRNFKSLDEGPKAGNTVRIVVYNSTSGLKYSLDKSGDLNMKIGGKAVGHVPMKGYRIIELEAGHHEVYLEHRDVWKMGSNHTIEIKPGSKAISISAFEFTHVLEVLDDLPFNFDAAYKRVE